MWTYTVSNKAKGHILQDTAVRRHRLGIDPPEFRNKPAKQAKMIGQQKMSEVRQSYHYKKLMVSSFIKFYNAAFKVFSANFY